MFGWYDKSRLISDTGRSIYISEVGGAGTTCKIRGIELTPNYP